jgi:hypothetical protein
MSRYAKECRGCSNSHRAAAEPKPRTCVGCGITFSRKINTRNKGLYCTRECAWAHDEHYQGTFAQRLKRKVLERLRQLSHIERQAEWARKRQELKPCVVCAKPIPRQKKATTCGSTECRSARLRGKIVPRYDRVCRDCGQAFVSRQRQITVCRTCSKRAWKRPGKYRDRCERAGVPWVSGITAKKVCERDRYRCQLCGCKTPKRLRGTFEPNAPELDHIVPINAEGGSPGHAWHNVQCACRRCNLKKSATPLGQLRLAV